MTGTTGTDVKTTVTDAKTAVTDARTAVIDAKTACTAHPPGRQASRPEA